MLHTTDGNAPQPSEARMSRIARRAHEIFEARGGEHGQAIDDWLVAEREIDGDTRPTADSAGDHYVLDSASNSGGNSETQTDVFISEAPPEAHG